MIQTINGGWCMKKRWIQEWSYDSWQMQQNVRLLTLWRLDHASSSFGPLSVLMPKSADSDCSFFFVLQILTVSYRLDQLCSFIYIEENCEGKKISLGFDFLFISEQPIFMLEMNWHLSVFFPHRVCFVDGCFTGFTSPSKVCVPAKKASLTCGNRGEGKRSEQTLPTAVIRGKHAQLDCCLSPVVLGTNWSWIDLDF